MKRQLLGVAAFMLALSAHAQDNPLWMRYCAISPDGTSIAFTYKGDIYTVPVNGGKAAQITTNAAHDTHPVWSPDGKQIAFASDRMGSMDIFVEDREGGIPKRLTTHSNRYMKLALQATVRSCSPPCLWKISASTKPAMLYSTMIRKVTKIPGASITLLLSHATSGCVHWTENAAIAS